MASSKQLCSGGRALLSLALMSALASGCGSRQASRAEASSGAGAAPELALAPGFSGEPSLTGSAGGSRAARGLGSGCVGSIAEAPSAILHVTDAFTGLQVLARSDQDTTLVILHPDGSYSCDDDSGGSRNPLVSGAFAAGDHQIWVGTYSAGRTAGFTLSFAEAGSASAAPGGPHHGTVTIENATSTAICRIENNDGSRYADASVRIEPGASGTIEVSDQLSSIWIVGCDGRVLFGGPNPALTTAGSSHIGVLDVPTLVLADAASAPPPAAGRRVIVSEPLAPEAYLEGVLTGLVRTYSDAMNGASFRASAFTALQEGGRAHRWPETFVALRMTSADWDVIRHRVSGTILRRVATGVAIARFSSGLCQATPVTFVQEHDGRDFSGALRFGDIGGNHRVPCAIAEAAAQSPTWAH